MVKGSTTAEAMANTMNPNSPAFYWNIMEGKIKTASPVLHEHVKSLRPWQDFFAFHRMSRPNGFTGVRARIEHNLTYYYVNYALISIILLIWTL